MPLFYMHVCNGNGFSEDQEGKDLPNGEAAHAEAVKGARDIMAAELRDGVMNLASFIEVEDAQHQLLFTLSFGDAMISTSQSDPS